jgi:hypothetical protein
MPIGYCCFMARMLGTIGRIGALCFVIIAFVAVLLVIWANFGQ